MGGGLSGVLDSKGTLSEDRKKNQGNGGQNAANIIDAGAGGLDSIANFISTVTGKGGNANNNNNNYAPPPPEKKVSPLLIGGIVGVSFLIIIVLIITKNGNKQ